MSLAYRVEESLNWLLSDHPETRDHGDQGLDGPEQEGPLLKSSQYLREWRSRFVRVTGRRLFYYDSAGDAGDMGEEGHHKCFLDLVGASVTTGEEQREDGGTVFTMEISEERGVPGEMEQRGLTIKLGAASAEERDRWVSVIQLATRPRWDVGSTSVCGVCSEGFSLTRRRHHCRRCGIVIHSGKCSDCMELPHLSYPPKHPMRVCSQCSTGAEASRHLTKVPRSQRSNKRSQQTSKGGSQILGRLFWGRK